MNFGKSPRVGRENKDSNAIRKSKNTPLVKNKTPKSAESNISESKTNDAKSDDKIKVYLRVRPQLKDEESFDFVLTDKTITIPPQKAANSSFFCDTKTFKFRSVLNSHSKQSQVYEKVAEPLLHDFLKGKDVLIFCYGNTNAGKTYTVMGTPEKPGLLQRILNRIVPELLEDEKNGTQLFATFNEIYNERIIDLLSDEKQKDPLTIGISNSGDTEIKGCVELPIKAIDDVKAIINMGLEARHRGTTEFNEDSSRSHTIFRLKYVNKKGYCWLSVVDLAGSERVSIINSTQGSFREACNINKSMLVLGKCIRSLREQSTPGAQKIPIPYRESKLTHIFKNLFEPTKRQAKAAMIINISPSILQINDTLFALQFAAKASECSIKQIANTNDFTNGAGSPDSSNYFLEQNLDPDSPQMIERRMRVEVQKEMEEYLLQMKMQYEHQIQNLTKLASIQKITQAPQAKQTKESEEIAKLHRIIQEEQKKREALLEELKFSEVQSEEDLKELEILSKEKEKLQSGIEVLKTTLETLTNFTPPQTNQMDDNESSSTIIGLEELFALPKTIIVN